MSDDSKGNALLVAMFGTALLTTIDLLISRKVFTPDSELCNIGLILAKFFNVTTNVGDDKLCKRGENGWKNVVVRLADKHSVEISGVYRIEDTVDKTRNTTTPDSSGERQSSLFDENAPTYGVITLEIFQSAACVLEVLESEERVMP